jgi:hypothetical protein
MSQGRGAEVFARPRHKVDCHAEELPFVPTFPLTDHKCEIFQNIRIAL